MSYPWWQTAVFYQIYVRSFADSNGDGVGDLPGIIARLDYLNDGTADSLGVDALWLTPVYPSPEYDFGYDVSDYTAVNPRFGDMADLDRLLAEAHRRKIRVILDFVPNHTSHEHAWFRESRSSRQNPKRDWYIWSDRVPNNWQASFGGRAWEYDAATGQFYLHSFLPQQPDLNWRNPAVREAVFAAMRFWLDRGVDGFRLDVINHIFKDAKMRDNPGCLGWRPYDMQRHINDRNQPEVHGVLKDLRRLLDTYGDRMAVGEINRVDLQDAKEPARYYGEAADELPLAFDFGFTHCPWNARRFARAIRAWEEALPPGGWPCYVLSNHDVPRHISRYGRGPRALPRAKLAAMMLLTLRGTPFLYYGEEIGLRNGRVPRHRLQDPVGRRYWPFHPGRDEERTPMQWDAGPNAGFTTGEPWLPLGQEYKTTNVATEAKDPDSLLSLYRRLIWLRKECPALLHGAYRELMGPADCLIYERRTEAQTVVVALNFGREAREVNLPVTRGTILAATGGKNGEWRGQGLRLEAEEGLIIEIGKSEK
ncbi:MAG: alpha-amylase family glycosyl hydrolase [Bacteroidota bacterium]